MIKQLVMKIFGSIHKNELQLKQEIIQNYEIKIKELEEQNLNLQQELSVRMKKIKVRNKKIKDLEQIIEELTTTSQIAATIAREKVPEKIPMGPIEHLFQLLANENYVECAHSVNLLILKSSPDQYSLEGIKELGRFIHQVFLKKSIQPESMGNLYSATLSLITAFSAKDQIMAFVLKNEELLNKRIIETQTPSHVMQLAELYFNLIDSRLKPFLEGLLNERTFSLSKWDTQLVKLLWYCFYSGHDKRLLNLQDVNTQLQKQNYQPEVQLYNLYIEVLKGTEILEETKVKINDLKVRGNILTQKEKSTIYKLLDVKLANVIDKEKSAIVKRENKETKTAINKYATRKMAFITKLPEDHEILNDPNIELQKESVQLLVYSDPFLRNQSGYIMVQVLTNQDNGKSYIPEKEVPILKKRLGSKWPDIRAIEDARQNEQKVTAQKLLGSNFSWPSTDIKGGYSKEENSNFKEESELKKLGYQITNMSRDKRWKVLEVAVKQLGLKQVAYTIAQNVKLRKGQKDGEKKFSYAIGEWEHDLQKLKVTYYKNNFTWPHS